MSPTRLTGFLGNNWRACSIRRVQGERLPVKCHLVPAFGKFSGENLFST